MSVLKKQQFNSRFEMLFNECLSEVKEALKAAKTQREKKQIFANYGLDLDDLAHYMIVKTDDTAIECCIDDHAQCAADFLGKVPKTVYNHKHK